MLIILVEQVLLVHPYMKVVVELEAVVMVLLKMEEQDI